jgi:hypothetical protein
LIRADVSTGELATVWASDSGADVFDLVPDGEGGATIVTGAVPGDPRLDVVVVAPDGSARIEWSWTTAGFVVHSADLQRSSGRVAYTVGYPGPGGSAPELHIVEIGSDSDLMIPTEGWSIMPVVGGWEPVGDRLLLEDSWENPRLALVDVGTSIVGQETGAIGDAGCWMADGTLAAGRWDSGYVENDWSSGTIELIDGRGDTVADYGIDVLAGALACLDGGRVAFTRYVNDFGTIVPETITVTIVGPDGAMSDITQQSLWVVGANAIT